jgi:hypothetical protein
MTIKQLGGVFGRNPTFNDAEVEGDLIVDGSIGIGTDSPGAEIEIRSLSPEVRFVDNAGPESTGKITYLDGRLVIQSDDTDQIGSSTIEFQVDNAEAARFNSSGNLAFPSGQGIDFSATAGTGTSELLDDYEEGAFVCTINGAVEPATLITSTGYYTKIGRDVFFQVSFESVDTTGYSGTLSFSGLPFVSASTFGRSITNIIQYSGATYTGSPVGEISSNSSIVNARTDVSGAPWGVMSHNAGSGRFFWITGSYKT